MDISKIKPNTKKKQPKRCGRGSGSGLGKTSGRGHKGAGQRSGKKLPYIGFSGGSIPFVRKIPKRGFRAFKKKEYQIVNLDKIAQKIKPTDIIDPVVLKTAKLIKDENKPVKILATLTREFPYKAVFKADSFSKKAMELIQKSGSSFEILKR